MSKFDVFVGYRSGQAGEAARVIARMSYCGMSVAEWSNSPTTGESHFTASRRAIKGAELYIALIGPDTFRPVDGHAPYIVAEIEEALQLGKQVVPVLVQDAAMPVSLPAQIQALTSVQWTKLRSEPDFLPDLDTLIERLRGPRATPPRAPIVPARAPRVFISHSTADGTEEGRALAQALEAEGAPCWIAPRDVVPGETYPGQIVRAIESCRALILLLTPAANVSADVLQEVQIAHSAKKLIAPVIVRGTLPGDDVRYFIAVRQRIDWIDGLATAKRLLAVI